MVSLIVVFACPSYFLYFYLLLAVVGMAFCIFDFSIYWACNECSNLCFLLSLSLAKKGLCKMSFNDFVLGQGRTVKPGVML